MLSPLRQSPDEDPGTATAEPEATAEVASPEGEAGPAAEQEPPAGESGASGPEDEAKPGEATPDPRSQMAETLRALRQEHPDLYDSAFSPEERERLAGGQEERGDEVALKESQLTRRETLKGAQEDYMGRQQEIYQTATPAFAALKTEVVRQAKLVQDGQATEITPDFKGISESIDTLRSETATATFVFASAVYEDAVQDALEAHTTRRYLTPEDRKRITDAPPQDRLRMRIHAQLDAAIKRGSTAEVKAAAKKEAEETLGLTEHLKKIQALIPANGATELKGSDSGHTDQELLADPNTPIEKIVEIRNRQRGG
jgi:hypothetical protein